MRQCNETVTLVRHIAEANADCYECEVIVGVSWFGKRGSVPVQGGGITPRDEYTVRIPEELVPEIPPKDGDLLVRGVLGAYDGKRSLTGREYFRISYVGDNRRGVFLRHLVVKNT